MSDLAEQLEYLEQLDRRRIRLRHQWRVATERAAALLEEYTAAYDAYHAALEQHHGDTERAADQT